MHPPSHRSRGLQLKQLIDIAAPQDIRGTVITVNETEGWYVRTISTIEKVKIVRWRRNIRIEIRTTGNKDLQGLIGVQLAASTRSPGLSTPISMESISEGT